MKIVINLTIWACLAFLQTTHAQENTNNLKDTLIIQIEGKSQLHVIGSSLKELAKYNRADSLKNLFVADYKKALQNEQVTNSTHRIHYLISKEGQRRMKAAGDAYTEEPFDLEAEKKRFQFNLPKIHYTIYDLAKDVEMHFYMEDSATVDKLENLHISHAIKILLEDKKLTRNAYKVTFERKGMQFEVGNKKGVRNFLFNANSVAGATLIGNRLSPLLGLDAGFSFGNKYGIPTVRLGFNGGCAIIYESNENRLDYFTDLVSYEGSFSVNSTRSSEVRWSGIHFGIIQGLENFGFPENAEKVGFHVSKGIFTYSVDLISNSTNTLRYNPDEKLIMSLTVRTLLQ